VSAAAIDALRIVAVTGLAIEARIVAGEGVKTVAVGGDGRRLEAALEREFSRGATAIISVGIAGALVAALKPGRWVIADAVVTRGAQWDVHAAWAMALAARLPRAVRGTVVGVDTIVAKPAEKRALGVETGAIAVDMESHVVARFAALHGIPFAVLRVIADPVGRAIAQAATRGMRSDGSVNSRAVLGSLARSPRQLPALFRNAVDARMAFRALSRSRRLLGPGLGYPNLG
jgi:adenosylhomocysteine nucleosidase